MLVRVRQGSWRFFSKIMWYGIMKEFDCKVSSSLSVCGKVRAEAFTHKHLGQDKKEILSQLDFIIRAHEKKRRNLHSQRRKAMGNLGPLSHYRENT